MKLFASILALSALYLPTVAHANDVEATSRTYTYSCGYFSNQVSEIEIVLKNNDLFWGTKVEAIFGYEGYTAQSGDRPRIPFEWTNEQVQSVEATGPSTWTFKHVANVHDRSSPKFIEALNITEGFKTRLDLEGLKREREMDAMRMQKMRMSMQPSSDAVEETQIVW